MYKLEDVFPKITRLELQIKLLILYFAMNNKSKRQLEDAINLLLSKFFKALPKELENKEEYVKGAEASAKVLVNKVYVPIVHNIPKVDGKTKLPKDLWSVAKGSPNVDDYQEKLKRAVDHLKNTELGTHEKGKKSISLPAKADLDVRSQAQKEMVDRAKDSGQDLFWLSSHPDCSERCEKWQGKLVSLSLKPIDHSMFTGKTDKGNRIYSFNGIENIIDKYGYKNNIINGFNCRHHLIAYKSEQQVPPEKYNKKEVERERNINANLRAYERKIRQLKIDANIYDSIDKKKALKLRQQAKLLTAEYKNYATSNGFAWEEYRIKI